MVRVVCVPSVDRRSLCTSVAQIIRVDSDITTLADARLGAIDVDVAFQSVALDAHPASKRTATTPSNTSRACLLMARRPWAECRLNDFMSFPSGLVASCDLAERHDVRQVVMRRAVER